MPSRYLQHSTRVGRARSCGHRASGSIVGSDDWLSHYGEHLSASIHKSGIILLVALSAKNGILIVEFARDFRAQGNSIRDAAFRAGHIRLRPILMTSPAFVFGVMPLLFATGAGAESRIALGAAVVFGMALNTLLATVYIPNFYELMQKIQEKLGKKQIEEKTEKV